MIYVNGRVGSDANNGLTAATAFRTVAHACAVSDPGGVVQIIDLHPTEGQPAVVIWKPIRVFTEGNQTYKVGLIPAKPTDTMITIQGVSATIERLAINTSIHTNFTGVGLDVIAADGATVRDFMFISREDADHNKIYGGVGIRHRGGGEGSVYERISVTNATLGFHVPGPEGSCCTLRNYLPSQNYRDFVMGDQGGVGGWELDKCKATNSGSPDEEVDVWHFYPGSSNCTFIDPDFCESAPNKVVLEGSRHHFWNPISAPASEWQFKGSNFRVVGGHANGRPWVKAGTGNKYL